MAHPEYILTLSCLDQRGIVHRVSGFLADHGCNIIDGGILTMRSTLGR